jgi:thiamine biosynthesis lipoprotein
MTAPGSRRRFFTSLTRGGFAADAVDEQGYWIRLHRTAMACRFEITLADRDGSFVPAARAALDEVDRLEAELSVFRETSIISELNRRARCGPVAAPRHVVDLLTRCQRWHRETGGAFDITTTPLSHCWGFLRRQGRVPDATEIDVARRSVGLDRVQIDPATGTVAYGQTAIALNLGAIGKGYALDRAGSLMTSADVPHALLSAGRSSLLALGGRNGGWSIDLVSPLLAGGPIAGLRLRNAAIGTSGAGEQFIIADGRRYGHVIDPRTGRPAAGVVSATVVASDAASADALSTAFFVGGAELARRYCVEHHDVLAIITPEQGSRQPIVIGQHPGARILRTSTGCDDDQYTSRPPPADPARGLAYADWLALSVRGLHEAPSSGMEPERCAAACVVVGRVPERGDRSARLAVALDRELVVDRVVRFRHRTRADPRRPQPDARVVHPGRVQRRDRSPGRLLSVGRSHW